MQEVFIKLIEQLNSNVLLLLGILVLAFYTVYKVGEWKQLFLTHNNRIEKMEKMPETIISIQTKVDLIYQYATVKSINPVNLIEKGKLL